MRQLFERANNEQQKMGESTHVYGVWLVHLRGGFLQRHVRVDSQASAATEEKDGLKVIAASLFSGGKESVYAIQLAQEQGVEVKHLIYEVPSFPSPHALNLEAVKLLAKSMNKRLTIVNLHEEGDELVAALKKLDVEALVAGDINVPQHIAWLNDKCDRAGKVNLVEPLWGKDTLVLFKEMFLGKSGSKFKAVIIGVDNNRLNEDWLGFTLSAETAEKFLSATQNVDPLGENGEYHTIVTESPLYSNNFRIKPLKKITDKNLSFLHIALSEL